MSEWNSDRGCRLYRGTIAFNETASGWLNEMRLISRIELERKFSLCFLVINTYFKRSLHFRRLLSVRFFFTWDDQTTSSKALLIKSSARKGLPTPVDSIRVSRPGQRISVVFDSVLDSSCLEGIFKVSFCEFFGQSNILSNFSQHNCF